MNIRRRLALQFSFITTFLLIFFSLVVYFSSSYFRQRDFYSRLKDRALSTCKMLVKAGETDSVLLNLIDKSTIGLYEENIRIFNINNKEVFNSTDSLYGGITTDFLNSIRIDGESELSVKGREIFGISKSANNQKYLIIASAVDKYGLNKLHYLRLILFAGIVLGSLISVLLGLVYAGRALKPVAIIINQAKNISASNIQQRLETGNGKDELARLAITFNELLNRLEKGIEMQKTFVSNASHELRTPFSLILAEIEIALMEQRSNEKYIETLRSISEEVKNINTLTNDLLDLTQMSQDTPVFNFAPVRVDELLLQSRIDLMKRRPEYNVTIDDFILPADENQITVMGNETLLKTAFINLMTNACKFSPDCEVNLKLYTCNRSVCMEFNDKGIGIPKEEMDRIFEPFYRGSNITGRRGHGLGLPLVKKIIDLHKGTIMVSSELNKGTKFVLELPVS